jgi:hypothetical protein
MHLAGVVLLLDPLQKLEGMTGKKEKMKKEF